MIRAGSIHIVDDDQAVRESIALLLSSVGYSPTCWESGATFLAQADLFAPGVALLDLRMPAPDGEEVHKTLRAMRSPLSVVMLTGHAEVAVAVRALRDGAHNFLEKPLAADELLLAVDEASEYARGPGQREQQTALARARISILSPREHEVLVELANGKTNKMIAASLHISPRTVEAHRAHILEKLGTASLPEALHVAFLAALGSEFGGSEITEFQPLSARAASAEM